MSNMKKVAIATVFYNPDELSVRQFISFADDGYIVVIANNGIREIDLLILSLAKGIKIVGDGINIGLAKGMNLAIREIFSKNSKVDSVVLLDQDSKPDLSMPIDLRDSYNSIDKTEMVACIGPLVKDIKSLLKYKRKLNGLVEVATIATSGTFITRENYEKVGSLKDDLFIDCIDHEWCFRAKSLGMKIMIDRNIEMKHDMGEDGVDWFGTYKPVYKSPIRHYYIVRNTISLLMNPCVPVSWRAIEFLKLIRRIIFYSIFSNNKVLTLRYIFSAVFDGLRGRLGAKN